MSSKTVMPPLADSERVVALGAMTAAAMNHTVAAIRPASIARDRDPTPGILISPQPAGTPVTLQTLLATIERARQAWPNESRLEVVGAEAVAPQDTPLYGGGDGLFANPTVYGVFGVLPGAAVELSPDLPADPSSLYAPQDGAQ